ncbi:GntR family transcriptional regulator [Paracoccus suum]|uniref:GntR family transcriptional regulator n=1 Tax=Paracoccus suum TaxID=2259340 RepID=A0A344PMH9_9RHOB|nr:GntR family transcriptional regulator [Paracoccus suum]AXC50584.1 GntR family transcriptional regulator [Paracoccus suum]
MKASEPQDGEVEPARTVDGIDPTSSVPLHVQVRRLIRRQTQAGILVDADGRLKTEAELGAIFGVSRITIRHALRWLVDEGLFSRTRGRGTFLRPSYTGSWGGPLIGFVEAGQMAGVDPGGEVLRQGMVRAPDPRIVDGLGAREVFQLRRLRLADGVTVGIEDAFYPPEIGLDLQRRDLGRTAIYRLFEDEMGFVIGEARQTISAVGADDDYARHLQVGPGDPLIFVERLTADEHGRPLELLRAHFVPQRYRLSITLSRRAGQSTSNGKDK